MAILEVNNLEKHFGSTRVLEDISFDLEQGKALAIIGSSGSGKTTLLRCLNFLETPDQGTISVGGNVIFDAANRRSQTDAEIRKTRLHSALVLPSFNLFPPSPALQHVPHAQPLTPPPPPAPHAHNHTRPHPPETGRQWQGLCPSRNRCTQGFTDCPAGVSRAWVSFAIRCRSAAKSTFSNWRA